MIEGLRAAGVTLEGPVRTPQEAAPDGPLAGKTIVVTGTLEGHTRESIARAPHVARREGDQLDLGVDQLSAGR